MSRMPRLSCSHCGSANIEVQPSPRDVPFLLGKVQKLLRQLLPGKLCLQGGLHVVVCRDCGHTSCIQVR